MNQLVNLNSQFALSQPNILIEYPVIYVIENCLSIAQLTLFGEPKNK